MIALGSGGGGGGVSSVNSGDSYIKVGGTAADLVLSLDVAELENVFAKKNDPRFDEAVKKAGGIVSIQAGDDVDKPAPGVAGRVYVAVDSQKIYLDNGSAWEVVASVDVLSSSLAQACDPSQTIKWSSVLDTFICEDIAITTAQVTDMTPFGRSLVKASDADAARTIINAMKHVAPSAAGNILKSDGSQWVSGPLSVDASHFSPQAANRVLAGPASGGNAAPTFRSLVEGDLPQISWSKITSKPTTVTIGTNSSANLNLRTNSNTRMTITSAGNVGVGTTNPNARLQVAGAIVSNVYNASSSTTIDWSNGNVQYTSASCGAFTFSNMQDGGVYSLIVQGSASGTCSFSHYGLVFRLPADHGETTPNTHTVYSFLRAGTNVYVTWIKDL